MAQTTIANLPTTSEINPQSYVIIERPGVGQGTYKSTVGDLQDAITVHAKVTQEDDVTTITVTDINGTTEETIVTPTATIVDNGDNTATITITDTHGVTKDTIVSRVILDPFPIEGSPNMLTSGVIYTVRTLLEERIRLAEDRVTVLEGREDAADARMDSADARMDRIEARITQLEQRLDVVEDVAAKALMVENTYHFDEPFKVNGETYETLGDAISAAPAGSTIKLIGDAVNSGLSVPEGRDFTLDLNGCQLKMVGPGAGSHGTETNGMQLLKGSAITIKNGILSFDDPRLKMGIQNYCDLTLDNVIINATDSILYVVSNNHGNVIFKNGTTITPAMGRVAFDVWYGMLPDYDDGVNVRIQDSTVVINGKVEFGKANRASAELFKTNASLTCPTSMELDIDVLTPPCSWVDLGTGAKVFKYTPEE